MAMSSHCRQRIRTITSSSSRTGRTLASELLFCAFILIFALDGNAQFLSVYKDSVLERAAWQPEAPIQIGEVGYGFVKLGESGISVCYVRVREKQASPKLVAFDVSFTKGKERKVIVQNYSLTAEEMHGLVYVPKNERPGGVEPPAPKVAIWFAEFDDGTIWGDPLGLEVARAERRGAEVYRAFLRGILEAKGEKAVLSEIGK